MDLDWMELEIVSWENKDIVFLDGSTGLEKQKQTNKSSIQTVTQNQEDKSGFIFC